MKNVINVSWYAKNWLKDDKQHKDTKKILINTFSATQVSMVMMVSMAMNLSQPNL